MDRELKLPHIPALAVVHDQSEDETDYVPDTAMAEFSDNLLAWEDAHWTSIGWDPLMDWVPDDNELMSLERAVCLTILGGRMFKSEAMSIPSKSVKVKTLRNAIASGALGTIRLNTNINVTPALIRQWIESCKKITPKAQSSAVVPLVSKTESSPTEAPSSSTTTESKLRQDAVSAMILSMQKRTKPQS